MNRAYEVFLGLALAASVALIVLTLMHVISWNWVPIRNDCWSC